MCSNKLICIYNVKMLPKKAKKKSVLPFQMAVMTKKIAGSHDVTCVRTAAHSRRFKWRE